MIPAGKLPRSTSRRSLFLAVNIGITPGLLIFFGQRKRQAMRRFPGICTISYIGYHGHARCRAFGILAMGMDMSLEHHEYTRLTLCFSDEGPYLLEDVYTPGWAASNYGGGTIRTDLPKGFYKGQTPETFAEHFGERFREQIRQNAELAAFLDEANGRQER